MRILKAALAATVSILPATAYADEADTIVVTASRGEQSPGDVALSTTVIAGEDIAARQSIAVIDLLRTVPGVTVAANGGLGGITSVFIRGANSDHTVALIDGVKLNDPATPAGGFDFGNLLTGNIERIEVVRGSQSVLWGSQAIGGVVNIITKAPTGDIAANAGAEYGWRDTARVAGNVSGRFGPVSASLGGGYLRSDGFSAFSEARGGTERDGYRNHGANAKVNVAVTEAVSVDLRGWYSNGKSGFDAVYIPADSREFSRMKEFVGYAGLNAALFDGRLRNRFAYALTDTRRENTELTGGVSTPTFNSRGRNERFEYQGNADLADGLSATFGAETEKARYDTSYDVGASARIDSFYGQLTGKPLPGLTLTAGVRHDDHDTFGGKTTFAANGVYTPNQGRSTFRASYGEGFKTPSLFQLFSDYGNATLRPESARGWDAGVTQQLVDGRIELGATWFQRTTRNLIDFIGCPVQAGICANRPYGTYDNFARARARGLEVSLALHPIEALKVQAAYSYIDAENRATGFDLARRPKHSVNASIDYDWAFGLRTGGAVTHVGPAFDDAANTRKLGGYVLVDLRAAWPITENVELFGRIENLFDERYETTFRYGTARRAAYAGVRLSL